MNFTVVAFSGSCCILAYIVGEDSYTGEFHYGYFAAYMLTDTGKSATPSDAATFTRVSKDFSANTNHQEMLSFCRGFDAAAKMWKGVSPQDWEFPGTIDRKNVINLE